MQKSILKPVLGRTILIRSLVRWHYTQALMWSIWLVVGIFLILRSRVVSLLISSPSLSFASQLWMIPIVLAWFFILIFAIGSWVITVLKDMQLLYYLRTSINSRSLLYDQSIVIILYSASVFCLSASFVLFWDARLFSAALLAWFIFEIVSLINKALYLFAAVGSNTKAFASFILGFIARLGLDMLYLAVGVYGLLWEKNLVIELIRVIVEYSGGSTISQGFQLRQVLLMTWLMLLVVFFVLKNSFYPRVLELIRQQA